MDDNENRWREWQALMPWQRGLYSLALRVEGRDPELAADLRAVAGSVQAFHGESCTVAPCPNRKWWGP